jgi:SEC-C motif
MTFHADYMRDIDLYFAKIYSGETPALPFKKIHSNVTELLLALRDSRLPGRFEVASIILSMNDTGRNQLHDALKYLDSGPAKGKQRSVSLPFASSAYGLTISNAAGERWDEELIHSAARMEQGRFARWLCVQLDGYAPRTVRQINRIVPGQVYEGDLSRGRTYLEQRVREANGDRSIKRNDRCPCGSGKKYKRCHGR